jgi:replicative DNA helicase
MSILQIETLSSPQEERNVLASVIQSQDAWLRVSDKITTGDFTHEITQTLWSLVDDMRNNNVIPTAIGIYERLPKNVSAEIDDLGGWQFLDSLSKLPIEPINIDHYAKKLKELTILRRGRQAGETIQKLAERGGTSESFLEKVDEIVNEIPGETGTDVILLGSIAASYLAEKRANPKKIPGLTTGYPILDATIQGLQPGRLYILGARTGQGKSVWCLNLVKRLAVDQDIPVLYISTEQTSKDEISRLISIVADTPEHYLDSGNYSLMNAYPAQVDEAEKKVAKAPIWFSHDPMFTPEKLYRTIKKFVITEKVQCVFFDYIRIPVGSISSKDKWALVGDLAYGLKAIASELNIPIVSAVQVNRDGSEQFAATGEIDGSSFALSDMIEQASSVAMVMRPLNREEKKQYPDFKNKRVVTFSKNRHGPKSEKILFTMESSYVKLSELKSLASP